MLLRHVYGLFLSHLFMPANVFSASGSSDAAMRQIATLFEPVP